MNAKPKKRTRLQEIEEQEEWALEIESSGHLAVGWDGYGLVDNVGRVREACTMYGEYCTVSRVGDWSRSGHARTSRRVRL